MPACEIRKTLADRAKLGIVALTNVSVNLLVQMPRALAFRRLSLPGEESSVRRILIFRIGNVGDIVAAVPTLEAIRQRFRDAHITLLTSPGAAGSAGARDLIRPGTLVDSL